MTMVVFVYGYSTFLPGGWSLSSFFSYYSKSSLGSVEEKQNLKVEIRSQIFRQVSNDLSC